MGTSVVGTFVGDSAGSIRLDADRAEARKVKFALLDIPETDGGVAITATLADYGLSKVLGILGIRHDTNNQILVRELPTTSVSDGVLTITGQDETTANKKRSYLLIGEE